MFSPDPRRLHQNLPLISVPRHQVSLIAGRQVLDNVPTCVSAPSRSGHPGLLVLAGSKNAVVRTSDGAPPTTRTADRSAPARPPPGHSAHPLARVGHTTNSPRHHQANPLAPRCSLVPWSVGGLDGSPVRHAADALSRSGRRDRLAVGVDDVQLAEVQRAHSRFDLGAISDHDPDDAVGVEHPLRRRLDAFER